MLPLDEIGIGEVDCQHAIVVRQVGTEEKRLKAIDPHFEVGQIARVAKKEAVRPSGCGADVAMRIDHEKAIAMLHDVARPGRRRRQRDAERRLGSGIV